MSARVKFLHIATIAAVAVPLGPVTSAQQIADRVSIEFSVGPTGQRQITVTNNYSTAITGLAIEGALASPEGSRHARSVAEFDSGINSNDQPIGPGGNHTFRLDISAAQTPRRRLPSSRRSSSPMEPRQATKPG